MTSNELLHADLLDILFDNRNKQYGAYLLRRQYGRRLQLALGSALSLILLLFFLFRPGAASQPAAADNHTVVVQSVQIPEAKIKPLDPPKPPHRAAAPNTAPQANFTQNIKLVDHNVTAIPDQTHLQQSLISNTNTAGTGDPYLVPTPPSVGTNSTPPTPEPPKEALVQREPEFPGGLKAWQDFLSRNLSVPSELQAGERKTVIIRFQVSAEGQVTGFEVVQSGGTSYDAEVIRVLRKMPRWRPAIVNSQPAARSFTQPVSFVGEE